MDIAKLNDIIEKKLTTNRSVENAVLVSDENETINHPIQAWDEESIADMASMMRLLNERTQKYLDMPGFEQMWVHSKDSYFIAVRCSQGILLLIKANNAVPLGGLRMIINDTIKALEAELSMSELPAPEPIYNKVDNATELQSDFENDNELIWRGRRRSKPEN